MLDRIRARFDGPVDVKRLRIDRDFDPEGVRLVDGRPHLLPAEVTRELDEVRPALELLPHRLPEIVRPRSFTNRAVEGVGPVVEPFRAVAARSRDELPRGEDARPRNPVLRDPFLQPERHFAERRDVADARDAALEVVAQPLDAAQRGVGRARGERERHGGLRVREGGMEIDKPRHHGLSGDVEDARVLRPVAAP